MAELDVRVALQAEDGTVILLRGFGLRHGPPEVLARMAAGEQVPASAYYFRETMTFEAPPGAHAWLNGVVALATGERRANSVHLAVFEVL